MINKFKSISRRTLAFLLTILMLLSSGIVGTLAANVDFVETGAYTELVETGATGTVYFDASTYGWTSVNCYLWNENDTTQNNGWPGVAMTKVSGTDSIWSYNNTNNNYTKVIFCTGNGGGSNQTGNLTFTSGQIYSRAWNAYTAPDTTSDLTAVLRGTKIMFYIGEPSGWGKDKFYIRDGKTGYQLDFGSTQITVSSRPYTTVAVPPNNDDYYIYHFGWNDGNYGSLINGNPLAGAGYITASGTGNATKQLTEYTVTASLNNTTINAGNNVGVTATLPEPHYGSTKEMHYYYTTDATVTSSSQFTELETSGNNLVTSGLEPDTYYVYPVFYDGYLYVRGSVMPLTVENSECNVNVIETEDFGSVQINTTTGNSLTVNANEEVTVNITPNTGYSVDSITGGGTVVMNSDGSATVTIDSISEDVTLTVTYKINNYKLTATVNSGEGTITGGGNYDYGTEVTLTATPSTGYSFNGWNLQGGCTLAEGELGDTSIKVKVNSNCYAYANFVANNYTVTFINHDGSINEASGEYAYGILISGITVTAPGKDSTAEHNYAFAGWSTEIGGEVIATDFTVPVGGVTLYATYTETVRSYDVTVSGENGTAYATYENTNGETVTINGTASVPYGTVLTLVANNPDIFYTTGSWDASVTGNTYTVTGVATLTYTYASKDLKTITITEVGGNGTITYDAGNYDFAKNPDGTYTAEEDATVKFTFTAPNGYSIASLNGNAEPQYITTTTSLVTSDTAIEIVYELIPSYTVEASANIAAAGTVTGGKTVSYGESVTLNATVNKGYTFTGWEITPADGYTTNGDINSSNITITPTAGLSAIAKYKANTGTVNFSAGEGGTVDNAGDSVEYPNKITSTASSTTDGYLFANWTVTSTNGTKVTDYNYTTNGSTITVEIFTDGVVVNAVANFSTGYKIDAYFLSSSTTLDTLTVKEENSDGDEKTVYTGTGIGTENFEGVAWNDAGELSFTAGYTDAVTAQFTGENPLTSIPSGKYVVVFNNNLSWSNVYMYSSNNQNDTLNGGLLSTLNFNSPTATLTRLGTTDYWYAYVDSPNKFIIFTSEQCNNNNNLGNKNAVYETNWTTAKPVVTPNKTKYIEGQNPPANGGRIYYTTTSTTSGISISTSSGPYPIKDYLYPEGNWCNKDAVWIYDTGSGVTVTFRTELINEFNLSKYETAYKAGKNNSEEYSAGWNAFTDEKGNQVGFKAAYEAAKTAIGSKTATQTDITNALEALRYNYSKLVRNNNITITLAPGMITTDSNKAVATYGTVSFVSGYNEEPTTDLKGKINQREYSGVTKATATRGQSVTISATVKDSSYLVEGFIVNGTKFYPASEGTPNVFTASIPFSESAIVIPVYFKDTVRAENAENVIRVYAQIGDFDKWGDYIAAFTWGPEQFGNWTGQLMIPDDSNNKGMYYTYVDISDIDGITFNNYGNCQVDGVNINGSSRYQAYDYYEFMVLKDYDNITFVLKESDYDSSYLYTSPTANQILNHSGYEVFTNIDGQPTDIYGHVLESTPTKGATDALYIIRMGHMTQDEGEGNNKGYIGTRTTNEETGETTVTVSYNDSLDADYLVNCYVYTGTGKYVGCFKSYELEDLEVLKSTSGRGVDFANIDGVDYTNKPVFVDYEALTPNPESNGHDGGLNEDYAKRYDGEWFAYNNDQANFTVEVITALQGADGEYTFANADEETGLRNQADWGNVNVTANDETSGLVTVSQGTDFTITAGNSDGYNFVGWYYAEKDENGNITIGDEYTDVRTGSGKATASALFVAVYEKHEEGTLLIRNFAYVPEENVDKSKGQTLSQHVPKAQGKGDMTLSTRYVQVTIFNPDGTKKEERPSTINAEKPYQDTIRVETGQTLEITMYTKPNIPQDYVYAWYRQTFDDAEEKIVNYEEVAPKDAPFDEVTDAGKLQSFTFTYKVGTDIPDDITIYSDVVHQSSDITITYYYKNRYNQLVSYTKPYTLTGTEFENKRPSYDTVVKYAPYVDDIYKKVTWELEEDQTDMNKNGTDFYVYAYEVPTFTVNLFAGEKSTTYKDVEFNTAMDVYAKDINSACNKRGGVWFLDAMDENGESNGVYNLADGDQLLNYGNYLGLVVTDDMNIVYTDDAKLVYQIILGDPIYGREQTTDSSGNNVVDKIYVDYIISYMIPHFSGDTIDTAGKENDTSDDVTLNDDVNNNTPVQIKTLEAAGLKIDYGVVLEMVNVNGLTTEQFDKYYGVEEMSKETYDALNQIILAKVEGTDSKGNGVYEDGTLATYFYVYESTNASNKNRVLKTFAFDNTPANQKKYYNVYGYLRIEDTAGKVETYYSNPKTLNIMDESIDNTAN